MPRHLLMFTLLLLMGCGAGPIVMNSPTLDDDAAVAVGQLAPGFTVTDENDDAHTLASLHDDRYLVLSFSRAHW